MLTHILFRSAIDNSQLLLRQPYVLIGNVFKNRIELTVNVNTLFHGDGQAWKAGDLRLSGSKNFFLAREKKSCREKYLERCWLKRAGALTLTVNSMRMWITSRLIFASKAPSPAKHHRQQSIFKHPHPNIFTPSSLKVFLFCNATKNISAKIVSAI